MAFVGIYAALCARQHFVQQGGDVQWRPLTTFKPPSVEQVGAQVRAVTRPTLHRARVIPSIMCGRRDVDLLCVHYNEAIRIQQMPVPQADDTVYFLDYTGPPGFPEQVARHAGKVVVIDHHKTAQESLVGRSDLPDNVCLHIDMDRSGASLARDYFQSIQVRDAICAAHTSGSKDGDSSAKNTGSASLRFCLRVSSAVRALRCGRFVDLLE